MTAPPITPVIPPSAGPGARKHGRTGLARRLPVAAVRVVPAVPADVVYGFGRIDASGWTRLGRHLHWVATQQISTHWIRHTTLTWVEGRGIGRVAQGISALGSHRTVRDSLPLHGSYHPGYGGTSARGSIPGRPGGGSGRQCGGPR